MVKNNEDGPTRGGVVARVKDGNELTMDGGMVKLCKLSPWVQRSDLIARHIFDNARAGQEDVSIEGIKHRIHCTSSVWNIMYFEVTISSYAISILLGVEPHWNIWYIHYFLFIIKPRPTTKTTNCSESG